MSTDSEKVDRLKAYVARIYEVFDKRPGMLGTPDEICVALTFLDNVNDILTDSIPQHSNAEISWYDFLIEKKLIVGADDKLKKKLKENVNEYAYLQELRREYFSWRSKKLPL